ncbi:hypothetical protein HDV03_003302 [Kappamyces sp. JEL0829]|nr:hypothetical protein HDV03_003302 [Kappamyces sp. JEL0829]
MKPLLLFRCASLDRASLGDIELLRSTTKTILDLRSEAEDRRVVGVQHYSDYYAIKSCNDLVVPSAEPVIWKINLAHSVRLGIWATTTWLQKLWYFVLLLVGQRLYATQYMVSSSFLGQEGLVGLNKGFLKWGGSHLKRFFDILSHEPNYPVVVHCSAGKDRTGLTIALVQALCGAAREDIVKSYALSYSLIDKDRLAMEVGKMGLSENFARSDPETMEATLDHIGREYGSVQAYLVSIGVSAEQQQRLRDILLA